MDNFVVYFIRHPCYSKALRDLAFFFPPTFFHFWLCVNNVMRCVKEWHKYRWHKCFVENHFSAIDTMCNFQKCTCTKCQKAFFTHCQHWSCYVCTNAIFAWLAALPWRRFSVRLMEIMCFCALFKFPPSDWNWRD